MYKAFTELAMHVKQLEKTVANQQSFINLHRSKVNLIDWLNDRKTIPEYKFCEMRENVLVTLVDVEYLFKNTYLKTLIFMLGRKFKLDTDTNIAMLPIVAFSQKQQLYIYDTPVIASDDQSCVEWRCIELAEFKKLINSMQTKLICALTVWKTNHIEITSQIENIYDKNLLKIVSTVFTPGSIKSLITKTYNVLKTSDIIMTVVNDKI
jgi:hypothetical protein